MSNLTQIIPPQNFELVRDRIAAILIQELEQQEYLGSDIPDFTLYRERTTPFDKSDLACINVAWAGGNFGNKDVKAADGNYTYHVDCYTSSPATAEQPGDVNASLQLHRLLGVVRAIIEAPVYKTLDFVAGSIGRVFVQDINIAAPAQQDAKSTQMGRLVIIVRVNETVELKTAPELQANYTAINLGLTDKGYKYDYNK